MIYLIILIYIAALALLYEFSNLKVLRNFNKLLLFITLVSLAAFRYRVGGDTYYYMLVYDMLPDLSEIFTEQSPLIKLQPLWLVLNGFSKAISPDFYVFQLIHALIVNSVIFYFFNKHSRYFFTSMLFYFFIFYGSYNFEILRESLAICVFLLGFSFLIEKKWIKYFLLVSISFNFHYSAIFLFFLPFMTRINLTFLKVILLTILAVVGNNFIIRLITSFTGADGLSLTLLTYADYEYSFFGFLTIIFLNILYPLSVLKFYQRYQISRDNNQLIVFSQFYILAGILSVLFFIFFRASNYFLPFFVILLVDIIHHVAKSNLFKNMKVTSAVVIFMMVFSIHTHRYFLDTSEKVESSIWINHWVPYHSIFDPQEDDVREELSKQH